MSTAGRIPFGLKDEFHFRPPTLPLGASNRVDVSGETYNKQSTEPRSA
jgi:hypothetical protein